MDACNAHYYATRDPFGSTGDFVTAPEISQMFGELAGLALADCWLRAGRPEAAYVELGPGRGTLAADALRAMAKAGLRPPVHLVETSPALRAAQLSRLAGATPHDSLATLPDDRPLLLVANEVFDALPLRQVERTAAGWRDRVVRARDGGFVLAPGKNEVPPPPGHGDAPVGAVVESCPAARAIAAGLAARLARQGGLCLAFDYGYREGGGDTLQAVRAHGHADPFADPGEADLTAHVDFGALAAAARDGGARVLGPVEQGQWLVALGIAGRAAALTRAAPDRAGDVAAAYRRLVDPREMGRLFRVLAIVTPDWPDPAGFA